MKIHRKILLYIFFLIILAKSVVWLFTIPIFQSPDEALHFAYVQYLVEEGKRAHPRRGSIVSQELISVAKILNFNWGKSHPVWQDYQTDWQEKIKNIDQKESREYVTFEQRTIKNPPLYYWLATAAYKLVYPYSFLCRFYAVRFFSSLLSLLTLFVIYKTGRICFKSKQEALILIMLVAVQPMFSFLSVSINNDILAIFMTTLFIYFALAKKSFWSFLTIIASLLVKPILAILILVYPFVLGKKIIKGLAISSAIILIIFLGSLVVLEDFKQPTTPLFDFIRYQIALADYQSQLIFLFNNLTNGKIFFQFWQYLIANKNTFLHNLFPWYWGVFGWLEATMPLWVYRILKIVCGLAFVGLIKGLIINKNKNKAKICFLILTIIIFSIGIVFNDFKSYVTEGTVFGIQGRYFLPVISAQMILLILGLKTLIPKKFHNLLSLLLIFGSVTLNIVGFLTMYRYFYG